MRKILVAFPVLSLLLVGGCAPQQPKCSSVLAKNALNQSIIDQLDLSKELSPSEVDSLIVLDNIRPSANDEKLRKLSCEADLRVGAVPTVPVRYSTQLDEKDNPIISMIPFQKKDLVPLRWELIELAKANRVSADALRQTLAGPQIYGLYEGNVTQAEGQLLVVPTMSGYSVTVKAFSVSCVGHMKGDATRDGNVLTTTVPVDRGNCVFTARFENGRVYTKEKNCTDFHGALCDFSGSMKKFDEKDNP